MLAAVLGGPAARAETGIVLGWNTGGQTSTYIEQASRAPGLNVVSPTWWHLTEAGGVSGSGDQAHAEWAHGRGIRIWPLFGNGSDPDRTHRVLTDADARRSVIDRVATLAGHSGVDGVNIDWEDIHTSDRDLFSAFVREASEAWRARGLTVSVDVTPVTDDWSMGNLTAAYDRRAIGAAADLVVLMAYDQHNRLRPGGPVAALPWVRDSVRTLLRDVPASKVVLGVPFYTYDWSKGPPTAVTMEATPAFLRRHAATTRWDEDLGLHVASYTRNGRQHTLWVEDTRSLGLKAGLVDEYGLAGVAAWRMGFETPQAWQAISSPPPAPRRIEERHSHPVAAEQPAETPERRTTPAPRGEVQPRRETDAVAVGLALLVFGLAGAAVALFSRARGRKRT